MRSMSAATLAPHSAVCVRVAFPEFGITKTVRVCPIARCTFCCLFTRAMCACAVLSVPFFGGNNNSA